MKITLISPFFYPDKIGIALYNKLIVDYLLDNGYEVTVLTAVPYYPEWKIKPPYNSSRIFIREKYLKASILRVKHYVPKTPTVIKRIIQLIHFTLLSMRYIFCIPRNSKIVVITPFTSSIITAILIRFFRGGKIWCHVQDFEFDAAMQAFKRMWFKKAIFKIETFLFNRCDVVSTISNSMLKNLKTKTKTKTTRFTNFFNAEIFDKPFSTHPFFKASTKPNLLYSGNIGEKQDWNFFIEFCKQSQDEFNITVVGDGAMSSHVKAALVNLNNVWFYNLVPFRELPQLLRSFDGHILFQKKEVINSVMPSKLIAMMLSGRPSFIFGNKNSEVKQIIDASSGGIYYSGQSQIEFVSKIKALIEDKKARTKTGKAAKKYAKTHYSEKTVLMEFVIKLKNT